MFFFLKILNESKARAYLKANGYSGLRYLFKWEAKLRAYTYQPKNQNEVDDLFRTMGRTSSYIFVPVNNPPLTDTVTVSTAVETAPFIVEVSKQPLADQLVEQCLHRGVIVTDDDNDETAKRLIAAYDKGATDTLSSTRSATRSKRPRKPKPE